MFDSKVVVETVINGEEIRNVVYNEDTKILIITFKDYSYCWIVAVTNELGLQHKRYLTFIRDSNNLADVKRNRNIKIIAAGSVTTDVVFPDFESLQPNIQEGDYIIVEPGEYTLAQAFTFKNGVDIECKEDVILNAQYSAGSYIQYGVFVDDNENFFSGDLDQAARDEMTDTSKIKVNRIFGNATVNILDCPQNRFMPIIRTYYNGEIYGSFDSLTSDTGAGASLYAWNGYSTARIKTIDTSRLIDNDYECKVCDLDSLTADNVSVSFFPGTAISAGETYGIIRNAEINNTVESSYAIDTIASNRFNYHYIHATDSGSSIFIEDTFAAEGCNVYAHNFKLETDQFTSGQQRSNWYNNGFTNTRNDDNDGGQWTYYEDSLTLV